ncbi:MAG: hypothetical protein KF699_03970 [Phycisphaeraceae bacterium]|nr:hypothetical protein [Phycisphaeraceae bacterium]
MTTVRSGESADGLYAMAADAFDEVRCLGGPFADIDDVLDACFDEVMARGCGRDAVFYIERCGGRSVARAFPDGAFPADDESI